MNPDVFLQLCDSEPSWRELLSMSVIAQLKAIDRALADGVSKEYFTTILLELSCLHVTPADIQSACDSAVSLIEPPDS